MIALVTSFLFVGAYRDMRSIDSAAPERMPRVRPYEEIWDWKACSLIDLIAF